MGSSPPGLGVLSCWLLLAGAGAVAAAHPGRGLQETQTLDIDRLAVGPSLLAVGCGPGRAFYTMLARAWCQGPVVAAVRRDEVRPPARVLGPGAM